MLTVLAGDPGDGKSTLTADIAARVTRGATWPDRPDGRPAERGRVLFLSAEDDVERTLVPRLIAAGADMSLVEVIDGVQLDPDGQVCDFQLARDVGRLHDRAREFGDVRLVVVDPITAYLGDAARDSHNTAVMRGLLAPLRHFCKTTGAPICAISHLNKGNGGNHATYRITGSLALPAHARAAYLLGRDPQDESRRVLASVKMNVVRQPPSISFRMLPGPTEDDPPRLEWIAGTSNLSARDLLARADSGKDPAGDEAVAWLRRRLAGGPVPGKSVVVDAEKAGIKSAALQRASKNLGVLKEPGEFGGMWVWRLPGKTTSPEESIPV
jgi:hypothetical protein